MAPICRQLPERAHCRGPRRAQGTHARSGIASAYVLTGRDELWPRHAGTAASVRAGSAFPRPRAGAGANPASAIPGRRHRTRSRPSQCCRQGGAFGAFSVGLLPFGRFLYCDNIGVAARLASSPRRSPTVGGVQCPIFALPVPSAGRAGRGGQAIAARFGSDSSGRLGEKNGVGREGDRGGRRNGGTRRAESMARLAAGRAIVAGGAPASRTECAASCQALPCRGGGGSPGALFLAAVRGRLRVHDFAANLDRVPPGAALRVLFYGAGARSQNPFTATLTRK